MTNSMNWLRTWPNPSRVGRRFGALARALPRLCSHLWAWVTEPWQIPNPNHALRTPTVLITKCAARGSADRPLSTIAAAAQATTGATQLTRPFTTVSSIVAELQIHTGAVAGVRSELQWLCTSARLVCVSPRHPHHE